VATEKFLQLLMFVGRIFVLAMALQKLIKNRLKMDSDAIRQTNYKFNDSRSHSLLFKKVEILNFKINSC
jgi:hypothetical protein